MAIVSLDSPETWETWKACLRKPKAKMYLRYCASGLYDSHADVLRAINSKDVPYYQWRQIPGFHELEQRLFTEPEFAAKFLACIYWPHALWYQSEVLAGRERGSKQHAARFIIHTADPGMRPDLPPKGSPEPQDFPAKSRLEEMLKGVSTMEMKEAEKEMDE